MLADRLTEGQRKAAGWTLVIVGGLTTVPLALEVLGASRTLDRADWMDHGAENTSLAYSG